MSTALYRRYRPESFADVIGQEHVTEPLIQALRNGRVNHAYLFSGPRGCGKTTSARILARCLNCEQGPTPDPCGQCESCLALARDGAGSIDVIEIDAASHGGVDDARDLRERAAFGPAQSRFKVYIIDEAHMVTPHGFNALLKVVEEPPEHVKFIFATTEPEKVLSTIRSRTHHYPFHLVPPQRLTDYLEQVCAAEGVQLEPGVLSFVTRAGAGSVRDSLSVLDQLISGAGAEGLTYERTAALLGFTDTELLDAVVDAVAAGDAAAVFRQVDKVMDSGHDPRRFVEDLLERYRDLIVLTAVGERAGGLLPDLPADQVERMQQQAGGYGAATLTRCADITSRGLAEMSGAVSFRLLLELVCARLLLPGAEGQGGHGARLERIERRLAAGGQAEQPTPGQQAPEAPPQAAVPVAAPGAAPAAAPAAAQEPSSPVPPADAEEAVPPAPAAGGLDTEAVRRAWPDVLDRIKGIRRVTWSFVVSTQVLDFDGQRLLLGIDTPALAETFRRGNHAEVVRQALSEAIGLDTRVEGTARGEPAAPSAASGLRHRAAPDAQAHSRPTGPPPEASPPVEEPPPADEPPPDEPRRRGPSGAGEQRGGPAPAPAGRDWADSARDAPPTWARADQPPAPAPTSSGATTAESAPSADDEDLGTAAAVGQPVIESVLGGTVIASGDQLPGDGNRP